jgi:hypothetical protein
VVSHLQKRAKPVAMLSAEKRGFSRYSSGCLSNASRSFLQSMVLAVQ